MTNTDDRARQNIPRAPSISSSAHRAPSSTARVASVPILQPFPPEVILEIIPYLTLLDILHYQQALPVLRPLLEQEPARRVRQLVSPYFSDVREFCDILHSTNSILSGSTATYILNPGDWYPGDLDIIADPFGYRELIPYLTKEGYESGTKNPVVNPGGYDDYDQGRHRAGQDYYYKVSYKHYKRKIDGQTLDIAVPAHMDSVDSILTYHSSAPMNYFDGKELHCLYPHLTFSNLFLKNKYGRSQRVNSDAAIAKYKSRGYRFWPGMRYLQDAGSLEGEYLTIQDVWTRRWRTKVIVENL